MPPVKKLPSIAAMKTKSKEAFRIPVVVDDHITGQSVKLTRCNYFSIETDAPSAVWSLRFHRQDIPICLGGLSGIVIKPLKGELFLKPADYNNLFSRIERIPTLFVDINEILFPTELFPGIPARGHVYRVGYELFDVSIRFQTHQISFEDFIQSCGKLQNVIIASESESAAFLKWEQGIIKQTKNMYPKNKKLALEWN